MTDIEKVRAEIERLKNAVNITIHDLGIKKPSEYLEGELNAYDEILSFIDSLDSKPNADLEQAAINFASFPILAGLYDKNTKRGFMAGAQWQMEQIKKEAVETTVKGYVGGDGIYIEVDIPLGIDVNEGDKVKLLIFPADE